MTILEAETNTLNSVRQMAQNHGIFEEGNSVHGILGILAETEVFATSHRDMDEMASRFFREKSKDTFDSTGCMPQPQGNPLTPPEAKRYLPWTLRAQAFFSQTHRESRSSIPDLLERVCSSDRSALLDLTEYILRDPQSDPRLVLGALQSAAPSVEFCYNDPGVHENIESVVSVLDREQLALFASNVLSSRSEHAAYVVISQLSVYARFSARDIREIHKGEIYATLLAVPECVIPPLKRRILSIIQPFVDYLSGLSKFGVELGSLQRFSATGEPPLVDSALSVLKELDHTGIDQLRKLLRLVIERDFLRSKLEDDSIRVRQNLELYENDLPFDLYVCPEQGYFTMPSTDGVLFIRENAPNALCVEACLSGSYQMMRIAQCCFFYQIPRDDRVQSLQNSKVIYDIYRLKFYLKLHVSLNKVYISNEKKTDLEFRLKKLVKGFAEEYHDEGSFSLNAIYFYIDKCVTGIRRNPSPADYYEASATLSTILQHYRGMYSDFIKLFSDKLDLFLSNVERAVKQKSIDAFRREEEHLLGEYGKCTVVYHNGTRIALAREGESLEIPSEYRYASLLVKRLPDTVLQIRRPYRILDD